MKELTTILKTLLVMGGLLMGSSAWAQSRLYFWQGGASNYAQIGGTIKAMDVSADEDESATNINVVKDNYNVICLQGANYSDHTVIVTLDAALATGDKIKVTGFRSKNAKDPESGFKAKFDKGGEVASSTGLDYVNINNEDKGSTDSNHGTVPNTCTFTVPAAADGSTTITMTRSHTNTNFWITKIEIVRSNVVYSKALSDWADADLTEWVGDKADYGKATKSDASTVDIMTRTANSTNGLYFNSLGGKTSNGYASNFAATACNFTKAVTTNANTLIEWNAVWNPGNATGKNDSSRGFIKFGDVEFRFFGQNTYSQAIIGSAAAATISGGGTTRMKDYTLSVTINKATNAVDYTFDNVSGSGTTAGTFGSIQYGIAGYMPQWSLDSKIKSISIVETPAPIANYTVKYVDGVGTEIKTSDATRTYYVGAGIPALLDTDKASFWIDTKKYIYESDDLNGKNVAENGSTIVTVTFREAANYSYTINAVDGSSNILKEISTGSYTEGESLKYSYPKYVAEGGDLYIKTTDKTNATVAITDNNQVINVVYSKSAEGTYYFYEFDGGYTTRADYESNGSAKTQTATVTVPASGIYVVTANCYGSADNRSARVKVGATTIVEFTTIGIYAPGTDIVSSYVLLEKDAVITVETSSSKDGIDYVILQKSDTYGSIFNGDFENTTWNAGWNGTGTNRSAKFVKKTSGISNISAEMWTNTGFTAEGDINQLLTNVPVGSYTLTADIIINNGNHGDLYAKVGDNEAVKTTVSRTDNNVTNASVNFTVTTPCNVKIGFKTTDITGNNGWIVVDNFALSASTVSATLGTNGYGTFASPYPLDLAKLPKGLTAYKASTISGKTVTFTAVAEAVQANTGLLLKGDAGESETIVSIPVAASGADISETNQFLVNTAGTTFTGDDKYYYFGLKKNTLTFGLFNPSAVAIPANKAYLKVLKSNVDASRSLSIVFDDEATGVGASLMNNEERTMNNEVYDLQGRRVDGSRLTVNGSRLNPGIYIKNGRKVVVK
jgi:hypothetical protein